MSSLIDFTPEEKRALAIVRDALRREISRYPTDLNKCGSVWRGVRLTLERSSYELGITSEFIYTPRWMKESGPVSLAESQDAVATIPPDDERDAG